LKGAIDAVLMDLTMPRMDGREAFGQIRNIQSNIPVILFSGFSEGESLHESLGDGLAGFIQKPFDLRDLKRVVHTVLGMRG
jgi:CheY-like chemotaxis protein